MSDNEPKPGRAGRPSVCRSCGAIVGAGESSCAVCGVPLTTTQTSTPRITYDRETLRFARAVLNRSNNFTIVFLVANFFVFLLMWHTSGLSIKSLWIFPGPLLIAYGAKLNALIDQKHEWWRFVTPIFVHGGLPHLLINMYSLWMVGPYVEKLYGSAKFVFFWVVTGIAGVVASYLTVVKPGSPLANLSFIFKVQDAASAGASGALFGLVGVLFVFGIKFRNELPEGFKRAFGTGLLPVIMINLLIGYLGRGLIDNAAHLGGLTSGAALALMVSYRRPGERASVARAWNVLQVAALVLVTVSFLEVAKHFNDPLVLPQVLATEPTGPTDKASDFLLFMKAINEGQEVFNGGDPKAIDAAVQALETAPAPDIKADQLKRKLGALLQRAKQLQQSPTPAAPLNQRTAQNAGSQLQSDFSSWKTEYEAWLKTVDKQDEDQH